MKASSWSYDLSDNQKINFCVWVLKWDGLHIPPFEAHSEGTKILQQAGLTAQSWFEWFNRVVMTQDKRLLSCATLEDLQIRLEKIIQSLKYASNINNSLFLPFNKYRFNEAFEREYWTSRLEQSLSDYQDASSRISPFCRSSDPPDLWSGSSQIKDLLWELWEVYCEPSDYRNSEKSMNESYPLFQSAKRSKSILDSLRSTYMRIAFFHTVKRYSNEIPYLEVFVVDYPSPVSILFPQKSAVLSTENVGFDNPRHYQEILRIVKCLAERDFDNRLLP